MALKTYTFRDGALRLYDNTGTPFYLEIPFMDANFSAPEARPRPEEVPVLNRGRLRNNDGLWHHILGPDTPIIQALTLSFAFRLSNSNPNYQKLRQALNLDAAAAWTVGGNTWVTTKGTTQVLSGGPNTAVLVTTPVFADSRKRCCNVAVLWTDPDGGALHIGRRWNEVYFPADQQQLNEGDDMVSIRCSGLVYGSIAEITTFPAGTPG